MSEPTVERRPRFIGGRPGPRLPPGQPESCGLHKPGRRGTELGKWRPGIEGEGSDSGERSVFLGPDSDAKR